MPPARFRLTVYARYRWFEACPTLRVSGPAALSDFEATPGYAWEAGQIRIDAARVDQSDAVLICRDFPRYTSECLEIIQRTHRRGIPLLYETDDILFEMPATHPDFGFYQEAAPMILFTLLEADRVTTSTPILQEKLRQFHPDVQVIPNYLDDRFWKTEIAPKASQDTGLVDIGYFGTHTHRPDLESIQPALLDCLNRYPGRVVLKIWGGCCPPELAAHRQVQQVSEGVFEYEHFAQTIQTQGIDFWIAPLLDTPFNRSKSAIKYLEYSATAAPGIYSRLAPYEAVIADGQNGFLAASPAEWSARLDQLITNTALRRQMGQSALQNVLDHWLLSRNASQFAQAYHTCRSRFPGQDFYSPAGTAAAMGSLTASGRAILERLDRLSFLERMLEGNRLSGASGPFSADDLFRLLRDAQHYSGVRDAELAAIRSSETYRLASFFSKTAHTLRSWVSKRPGG